jgi:hypothetical protein
LRLLETGGSTSIHYTPSIDIIDAEKSSEMNYYQNQLDSQFGLRDVNSQALQLELNEKDL